MNGETQYVTIKILLRKACVLISYNEARILLQKVLQVNHAYLIAHPDHKLLPAQINLFQQLVKRRTAGEPIVYILGECEFYSIIFKITPSVLIPRPETELLVDLALEKISLDMPYKILDLGTGSGIIAISIAKHRTLSNVTAVENSADAIVVARKNIQALRLNNVHIVESDWFEELHKVRFDLIISNPPYVAKNDPHLYQGDLRFEPESALIAGQSGIECIQTIISSATSYLKSNGWLLFEHAYNQADLSRHLLEEAGFSDIFSHPDLAGIIRISGGRFETPLKKTARMA